FKIINDIFYLLVFRPAFPDANETVHSLVEIRHSECVEYLRGQKPEALDALHEFGLRAADASIVLFQGCAEPPLGQVFKKCLMCTDFELTAPKIPYGLFELFGNDIVRVVGSETKQDAF